MKPFRIFLACFVISYFGAVIYLDDSGKLSSGYWLAFKLLGLAVILASLLFILFNNKANSKSSLVFACCFLTLCTVLFGLRGVVKYKSDICDDRFGREFNARRRKLGTPEIPADWHVDHKRPGSFTWKSNDTLGHTYKYLDIDSTCAIELEADSYKLKLLNSVSRYVSIETHYARGKGSDSIFYYFGDVGDNSKPITRQQADSIFAAEKIKKDY